MTRYLTSSKVALLALISLYVDSVVPTAATIPVLSFIVSHLLPPKGLIVEHGSTGRDPTLAISIDDFRKATVTHVSGIPGRTIWDLLLKKLWEINSLDALHAFFDSLSSLLPKAREEQERSADGEGIQDPDRMRLSRNSPLGIFVRRAQLEFTRLQLHDSIILWQSFVAYRESTLSLWKRRNPTIEKTGFDVNIADQGFGLDSKVHDILYGNLRGGNSGWGEASTEDVEKLLEFQIDQMQRRGQRLTESTKQQIKDFMTSNLPIPSLSHYLKFLDSWRAGDYPSSFDHLHRYFDYTMQTRDRTFYQYALLNLAILQADFGCFSEALAAMQESISTARENKDMACLNYSLSWLYHFGKVYPDEVREIQKSGVLGTDKEALAFLKAKAKDTNMWSLLSTCLLSEASLAISNGENLAGAFENILKASHVNITKHIPTAMGSQMMMTSSLFSRLGVGYVAWSQYELFLERYADKSPMEDALHFMCKYANSLALKGRYEQALVFMENAGHDTLRMMKYQQYWMIFLGLLKLRHSIYKGDLVGAQHFLQQIQANPPPDQDLAFTSAVLEINFQIRRANYSEAMALVEKHSAKIHAREGDIFQRLKLMILKARIYDKAGAPQKGFSVAMRAASLAHKARILPSLWEAVGAVCRVLLSLGEFEAATKLLRAIIPQVLECEDCELTANMFACLADAHMGMAGEIRSDELKCKEQMTKTLEYLGRAFDEYSRIHDVKGQCEMMTKKSMVMHLNGDLLLANDYASKYLDIQRAAKEELAS